MSNVEASFGQLQQLESSAQKGLVSAPTMLASSYLFFDEPQYPSALEPD